MECKVLFICGRNRLRSPTAEHIFADWPGIETASAGLNRDADNPVSPEWLRWADLIFVMERAHRAKLSAKFQACLGGKLVVCLEIPDEYTFMDPELIRLLKTKVSRHLPQPRLLPQAEGWLSNTAPCDIFFEQTVDKHGRAVEVGTRVRVVNLSGDWFDQLLPDERADVESMIGEIFPVEEIDEHGHSWVRKGWSNGVERDYRCHFIALEPDEMECVTDDELSD